jgi:glycosyltransferase involved in cell wall biosynthesis
MTLSLAFAAEGDANTRDCWSGCALGFVSALRRAGVRVDVVDAELNDWSRWPIAALTFRPNRAWWRQRFILSGLGFHRKSELAAVRLAALGGRYDAVIQAGATFSIPRDRLGGARSIVYADANIRFAVQGRPYSRPSLLADGDVERIATREGRVYAEADRIWTWSEALGRSFQEDFGVPPGNLRTIYAGADDISMEARPTIRRGSLAPSILFIGKDHVRKGSELLLAAFPAVREVIPDAELHLVGAIPPGSDQPGVHAHGFLSRDDVAGRTRIQDLIDTATVFCLPSRYEPFGVVFVEAMLAGLPCIGTRRWAMPEIIDEGKTGWLVEDGSRDDLAATLILALTDRERALAMGAAGRERALALFTWDRVAARAVEDLNILCAKP